MAVIHQKLDEAFLDGKISNKDRFEFLDLIKSGKLSKVELALKSLCSYALLMLFLFKKKLA